MPKLRRLTPALIKAVAIVAGIGAIQALTVLNSWSQTSNLGRSLEELYQVRDRLIAELETPSPSPTPTFFSRLLPQTTPQPPEHLRQKLQAVEVQILVEQRANDNWQQAVRLANEASEAGLLPNQSIASWQQTQLRWQQAINNLREIPPTSFLVRSATSKIQEYQENFTSASFQLQQAKSAFLMSVAQESGLSNEAMITVCHFTKKCVHLRGNQLPESPASLIKVPVALALLHKIASEKISLNHQVYVEPGNFTEDASQIIDRQRYPLKKLLEEMIDRSSNIATNELIDYLGSDYINQVLDKSGYPVTRVNSKLMGESTLPFNLGSGPNRLTTDELTQMMLQVYNGEIPGNRVLRKALSQQYDRELGFAALQGTKAKWLGEKTGENSKVLGTTLAFTLDGEGYVITVIDNHIGGEAEIRQCIAKIVNYLAENGHL